MAPDRKPPSSWEQARDDLVPYLRRLIVTILVVGLALLLWELKEVLLLGFAAILVAVALLAVSGFVERTTGLKHRWALAIAGILIVAGFTATIWLSWPSFQEQLTRLSARLDEARVELEELLGITLPGTAEEIGEAISGAIDRIWSSFVTVAGALVSVLTTLGVVIFSGVFLAVNPKLYRRGLVLLFPRGWHQQVESGLDETSTALRLWLRAQILTMLAVGLLVGVGAALIGLPAPAALGVIAGLTEFVPIIGPFIGAIPGVLVAVSEGGAMVLWAIGLYVVAQQIEANLITPVLQRRIVSIPPVLLLLSFVALGIVFGPAGIIVAAPLTIALYVLVREFYIGEVLNERDELTRIGEHKLTKRQRARRMKRSAAARAKAEAAESSAADRDRSDERTNGS